MRNTKKLVMGLLLMALLVGACFAEDATPPKFYKLEFVVKEVEGAKILNARTYSVMVSTQDAPHFTYSVRAAGKVPYSTGKEYQYLEVGVNIDCMGVREVQNGLSLEVHADISSIVPESTTNADRPVLRQNKWSSMVLVPIKRPTVIFSSDDLTGKGQMQLELTAAPIT